MRVRSVIVAAVWVVAALAVPALAIAQQIVYVVRHAERADGGAGTTATPMQTPADPLLSAEGEARARKLAAMLADAGIKAIFATEFKRTQDAAKPLAARLGVTVENVAAASTAALIAKVRQHPKEVVLIVGHSNTLPAIIKALGGPAVTINDEYDSLFVVVPASGAVSRIRF